MLSSRVTVPTSRPTSSCRRSQCRRSVCKPPKALFGWGKKDSEQEEDEKRWKQEVKDEQFQLQQEILAKRRTGAYITEANERRDLVAKDIRAKVDLRQSEKDSLGRGEMPETLKTWKNYNKEDTKKFKEGLVIPLLPFGIKKFDEGERFDLRSPYADEGWVDPDEVDMWSGLKKLGSKIFNFSGKKPESQIGKPILWASKYSKYKAEQGGTEKDKKDGNGKWAK